MASEPLGRFVQYFRQRLVVTPTEGVSDGQLVERFARQNDEAAFDALMQRHGPMVLSVCQRVLRRVQDVEDTFQATFLMLVREAGSLRKRASVASWLYRVAYRLALRMSADVGTRPAPDRRGEARAPVAPEVEAAWSELKAILDEELDRLPAKYRAPLVLCYLEGKTHEEAAQELHWPPGTVKGRLSRARDMLRKRLTRRGLAPVAGSFAAVLAANTPSAAVPATLAIAARKAGLAPPCITPRIAALVDGHTRALLFAKLRTAAAVVLVTGLLAGGASLLVHQLWSGNPETPAAINPPLPDGDAEIPAVASAPRERTDALGDLLPREALARLGTVRLRIGSPVYNFAFSRDGQLLASGGDRTVIIWNAITGKEVRQLTGHESRVTGVAFSPDGRTMASGSADRTVRIWDLATGAELRRFEGHDQTVGRVLFSPDGQTLVSGSADKTVRLWDANTGKEIRRIGKTETLLAATVPIAFLPDKRTVATWSFDGRLFLWDVTTGAELPETEWLPKRVSAAAFSHDGVTLAAVSAGSATVRLWDVATGKELRQLRGHRGVIDSLVFSPDGTTVASSGAEGTIRFWEVTTGKELRRIATGQYQRSGLAFSPDASTIASGLDTSIRLWNVSTGDEMGPTAGHRSQVRSVAFLPDGRTLISAGPDKTVRRWEPATGKELGHWEAPMQDPGALAFALAPDGKLLACGSNNQTIHLRDPVTGEAVRQWQGHKDLVSALAFSWDSRMLASASWDKTIGLWDPDTGEELGRLEGHRQEILAVAFSPDGKLIASGGIEGIVYLWDVASGKVIRECGEKLGWVRSLAFAPDGKTIAVASGTHATRGSRGLLSLWEVATGEERARWEAHGERAYCVAYSPDGALIASGGELAPLEGHRGAVVSVAFAPDGRSFASGSMDTTVLVWPVKHRPVPPP
jgi:RNA polymerase sigma factor (sigma-70 family)